jgi:putative transposase
MFNKIIELEEYCTSSNKTFRLMFQDEAGFGRINKPKRCWCGDGIRPTVPCHRVREYIYAYGAVSPLDGDIVSLVLPKCNTQCMSIFLDEVSKQYPNDYILMIADNAPWHKSNGLIVPENMEIFSLLPYTPELNPIEMIWDEIREKFFKNKLFKTLNDISDKLCEAIVHLIDNKNTVKSITGWHWILSALSKTN